MNSERSRTAITDSGALIATSSMPESQLRKELAGPARRAATGAALNNAAGAASPTAPLSAKASDASAPTVSGPWTRAQSGVARANCSIAPGRSPASTNWSSWLVQLSKSAPL